jgi:hypothetical protein
VTIQFAEVVASWIDICSPDAATRIWAVRRVEVVVRELVDTPGRSVRRRLDQVTTSA